MRPDDTSHSDRRKAPAGRRTGDAKPAPAAGTRLSAAEIHDNVRVMAEEELVRPGVELLWSALAAGLVIGFSFLAGAYLATQFPEPRRAAAAAIAYPLGFILVVQARSQLFTENTLEPVIPLLHHRDRATILALLRLWGIVLAGNLVGTFLFAGVIARTPAVDASVRASLVTVAAEGTSGGFWLVLYRGIFGGWLVALMAWLVSSTRASGAQIVYIWLTTAPIAALGFRHSIAGAAEAFYRAVVGTATWEAMIAQFLIPAILGNIVGGVVLVALLNHGQVASARARWVRPEGA
jgi:formate/nitrite transporter FocA (FNT family)